MTGLDFPNFMTVDRGGSNVYFVTGQTCGDKIVKFDVASHTLTTLLTAPSPHDTDHGFDGLFINSLGDLYFSTCDYLTINRLPRGSSTPQVIMTVNTRPEGIAVDNAGNVFFTLYYQSVDALPVGSSAPIILATGSTLHQLALDSDDNVYYTDSAGGKIWKIPIATVVTSPVTVPVTTCTTTTVSPWGITVSTDKSVYGPSDVVLITGSVSGGPSCYCPCGATCTCTFAGNIIVQLEVRNDLRTVYTKTLILSPYSSIRPYSDSFSLSYALESGDYQVIARASYTGQMSTLMVSGGLTLTELAYPPVEARSSFRLEGTATTATQMTSATSTGPMSIIYGGVYWTDQYGNLRPMLSAQVTANDGVHPSFINYTTDGAYTLQLTPGTYDVTASSAGFYSETHTHVVVTLGSSISLDFTLQPTGSLTTTQTQTSTTSGATSTVSTATTTMPVIHGTVYWIDQYGNMRPLAWAQVAAVGQNGLSTLTSSHIDGTYVMYLAPGTYNMTASLDPDYRPDSTTVTVSALGLADFDFTLAPSCTTCTATTTRTPATNTATTIATLQLQVASNSTVSGLIFDSTRGILNFTVTGPTGTRGFFDATIAKSLFSGQPVVLIDGVQISATVSGDTNFWYIHVTYPHSQHHVTIGGSNTVPEFPSLLLFPALLTVLLVVVRRERKIED